MHFRYDRVITKLAAESAGKRNENWSALGSYVQEYKLHVLDSLCGMMHSVTYKLRLN